MIGGPPPGTRSADRTAPAVGAATRRCTSQGPPVPLSVLLRVPPMKLTTPIRFRPNGRIVAEVSSRGKDQFGRRRSSSAKSPLRCKGPMSWTAGAVPRGRLLPMTSVRTAVGRCGEDRGRHLSASRGSPAPPGASGSPSSCRPMAISLRGGRRDEQCCRPVPAAPLGSGRLGSGTRVGEHVIARTRKRLSSWSGDELIGFVVPVGSPARSG
jgi:hypothetical protein